MNLMVIYELTLRYGTADIPSEVVYMWTFALVLTKYISINKLGIPALLDEWFFKHSF